MNFVKFFVPVGQKTILVCPDEQVIAEDAIASKTETTEIAVIPKRTRSDSEKPVEFSVSRRTNFVSKMFEPNLRGKVVTDEDGHKQVELTTRLGPVATRLVNIPANMALGALFGSLACFYLIPDIQPMLALFTSVSAIPLLLACIMGLLVGKISNAQIPQLVEAASQSEAFKGSRVQVQQHNPVFGDIFFTRNSIFSIVTAFGVLVSAYALHQEAWNLWTRGDYQKSEAHCHTVLQMARFILGSKSPVVADCQYYIAECLRCQGKYEEAEKMYLLSRESIKNKLADAHGSVADSTFNLARAYEGEGKLKQADETYKESVKLYEALPNVGPKGVWLARVLDRQAMMMAKNNQLREAEAHEKRALEIDQQYGSSPEYKNYPELLNDLGVIYYRQDRFADAKRIFGESISARNNVQKDYSIAVTKYNLGKTCLALGDKEYGQKLIDEARKTWAKFLGGDARTFKSDSELYQAVMDKTRQDYEVPNWDTRSQEIISLTGRI